MSDRDRELIEHIQLAAQRLEEVADAGRDYFEASWMVRAAAEHQLEIIGEAVGKLSHELAQQRPRSAVGQGAGHAQLHRA